MTDQFIVYVTNGSLNQAYHHLLMDHAAVERIEGYMCDSPEIDKAKAVFLAPPSPADPKHGNGCWDSLDRRIRSTPDTLYFMLVTGGNTRDSDGNLKNVYVEHFMKNGKPKNLLFYNFDEVHDVADHPLEEIAEHEDLVKNCGL